LSPDRLRLAERLLQEAVYHSRSRQTAGVGLGGVSPGEPAGPGRCGLGGAPDGPLELTGRGEELLRLLFPQPIAPSRQAQIGDVLADWVGQSDALDRRRNHFLRDFRVAHGFDRRAYTAEEAREFESGLAGINAEMDARLSAAAQALLRS
jgi:hypothetical protein